MSARTRARVRIDIGSRVKVCVNKQTELLLDMGLTAPDGNPLQDIWMFGTVESKAANYYTLNLPAAEESVIFPKEQVIALTNNEPDPPDVYVLFPTEVKTVPGLLLKNFWPTDYFEHLEDAQKSLRKKVENGDSVATGPENADAEIATNTGETTCLFILLLLLIIIINATPHVNRCCPL